VDVSTSGGGDRRIVIYDRNGNLIRELLRVNGSGNFVVPWDLKDGQGRSVSAGTYFVKMTGCGEGLAAKLIVVD
jgi:flagellar hook assembly protein FlgD